jgi:hypothetical protein
MNRTVIALLGVLLSTPSSAAGSGHFAPQGVVTPPAPRNMISPFAARPVGINQPYGTDTPPGPPPHETIAPPAARPPATGPLVKPAWMD